MPRHKFDDLARKKFSPEKLAEMQQAVDAELLEMDLRAMRELTGKTQEEVAKAAGMAQGEVSRSERRSDHRLSTLRRIVDALGGELEVIANFGDKRVKLRGV